MFYLIVSCLVFTLSCLVLSLVYAEYSTTKLNKDLNTLRQNEERLVVSTENSIRTIDSIIKKL